jgi:type IV pilus assembly protein PilB
MVEVAMDEIVKERMLGDILRQYQIISETDVNAALEKQQRSGCRFGEALVQLGIVTQEDIDWALSNQLNLPYVRLKQAMIDSEATALVPATLARKFNLIPLIRTGDELQIAMADPLNDEAVEAVAQATGCQVSLSVALLREIRQMQEVFYGAVGEQALLGFSSTLLPAEVTATIDADPTGGKLLDWLLLSIIQQKLSSLSLQPLDEMVSIVAKRSGISREVGQLAVGHYPELLQRIRKLSNIMGTTGLSARGKLVFVHKGTPVAFQVALLKAQGGDYVTISKPVTAAMPGRIAEAGITTDKVRAFQELAAASRGLVLFASRDPDERGHFIDLYLDECDTRGKTVMLLGEGVVRGRHRFPRISIPEQPHGGFNGVVSAVMDHDPDIVVIEDITEHQSFIAACKVASRGKLVVAGLSCNDTASAVRHLHYFWHKNYLIPSYLYGIVTFKCVAILCPDCKESFTPSAEEIAALRLVKPPDNYYRSAGCALCDNSGYRGKRYLLDVVRFGDKLRDAFEGGRDSAEVMASLQQSGYRSIIDEGRALLETGAIAPEEYLASVLH